MEGNVRKIIGGSYLTGGEYDIPVKAINYNGEDSKIIKLTVIHYICFIIVKSIIN